MTRTRKPRKSYPKAFKLEALRLMAESDRPSTEGVTQKGSRRRRGQVLLWRRRGQVLLFALMAQKRSGLAFCLNK